MKTFQTTAVADEQGQVHLQVPGLEPGTAVELLVVIALAPSQPPHSPGPTYTRPVDVGECLIDNVDNVEEVLSLVEGEDHK